MSLTSHLSNENSIVFQYFKNNFNLSSFLNEENKSLMGAYTIKPKSFNDYPWADMGHMVEYLLILHMGLPVEYLFPMRFAKDEYPQIYYEMKRKYDNFFSKLDKIDFKQLSTDLYKLSKIEGVFRNGAYQSLNYISNLNATESMRDDLKTIYDLSLSQNEVFNDSKVRFNYNPSFDLSGIVGGADADLYMLRKEGNYLIDLKTTLKPVVKDEMIYQLLGYVFLDKSNKHKINKIGLYLPRQNLISEWLIEELIVKNSVFKSTEDAQNSFLDMISILNAMNKKIK